jgi:cytochrome c1
MIQLDKEPAVTLGQGVSHCHVKRLTTLEEAVAALKPDVEAKAESAGERR